MDVMHVSKDAMLTFPAVEKQFEEAPQVMFSTTRSTGKHYFCQLLGVVDETRVKIEPSAVRVAVIPSTLKLQRTAKHVWREDKTLMCLLLDVVVCSNRDACRDEAKINVPTAPVFLSHQGSIDIACAILAVKSISTQDTDHDQHGVSQHQHRGSSCQPRPSV